MLEDSYKTRMKLVRDIGVARGALAASAPEGRDKFLWRNLQGQIVTACYRQNKE